MSIRSTRSNADYIDDDVLREQRYISAMSKDQRASQILVLDNVSKYYGRFLAVNQISLCVKKKECFGLLGLNGAGKTTTFKMMTGDESITIGSGYVTGLNLATNMGKIYKKIGYCPQFDALLGEFTGRETLKIYCLLRGIRGKRIPLLSEELAKSLGFFKHLDKRCHTYSGGTKRKLSAALAILGSPSIVYLDEPTAGMDPDAKRQVWNMICRVRDAGSSIILTSHSMDEIEAICTRLVIMVNGEFKCIGSLQHLKNKFSRGLVLKIKVKTEQDMQETPTQKIMMSSSRKQVLPKERNVNHQPYFDIYDLMNLCYKMALKTFALQNDVCTYAGFNVANSLFNEKSKIFSNISHNNNDNRRKSTQNSTTDKGIQNVKQFVQRQFANSVLQEEYQGMLTYYIPLDSIKWSKIFGIMENNRAALKIVDYSINQTTLEEIFLELAKTQVDDKRGNKQKKNWWNFL